MPPSALTTTFIQSTFLNAIANLLAQVIDQYHRGKPFHLNPTALLQFLIYGLLSVLPNFLWQRRLESRFPGFPAWRRWGWSSSLTATPTTTTPSSTLRRDGKPSPAPPPKGEVCISIGIPPEDIQGKDREKKKKDAGRWRSYPQGGTTNNSSNSNTGVRNFLAKFLLDQTVGSVMNIVLFVVLINLLKGVGLSGCWGLLREDFRPIMMARLKYRPLVSVLMYTVIPVDRRVVFGSACGVIWGVYLSLYAVV
ncbi:hypothetical protein BO99DRAFT_400729 [Aspergillus violaceofuscus CBS 115571]|uniref:Uncharacterized protein n=1 Tax=Aspergillus violaceofuscus (strain CBS 115571) TaxID=1450538 RepID=A0A2V5HBI2_ASPV1|nr:hypothetical protein BO99DRAFT_400729 [Aspergillus violaceofuscus CBS 115571]